MAGPPAVERSRPMSKFVLVYTGGAGMAQTPEEQEKAMAAWGAWFGELGSAVVEIGNPFGASTAVKAGGTTGSTSTHLGGYSVIEADSLEGAAKSVDHCPVLESGGSVEIYEAIAM
jgi:hypothetical protein